MSGGLADQDRELLEELVENGGQVSPQDAAEETDYHVSTIYDAIDRMDHLVDHGYGELAIESSDVEAEVREIVESARRGS